jgi:methylglyoxal reductase
MDKTRMAAGLETSRIALGTWAIGGGAWWGDNDDTESERAIRASVDAGVTLIDTAPAYGYGHSEEVTGRALKGIRDSVRVSTKCGLRWDTDEGAEFFVSDGKAVRRNLSAASIRYELETSLRRLQTDRVDIYIIHWPSVPEYPVPVEETMGALLDLKSEGKILGIGVANFTPELLGEYLEFGQVELVQNKCSILTQESYLELSPVTERSGVAFQAYSPLESGLLTGKIADDYAPAPGSAREGNPWFSPANIKTANEMMREWKPIAEAHGATFGQLAIAWLAAKGDAFNVLCGARTAAQAESNAKAGDINLTQDEIALMDKTSETAKQKFV